MNSNQLKLFLLATIIFTFGIVTGYMIVNPLLIVPLGLFFLCTSILVKKFFEGVLEGMEIRKNDRI